MELRVRDLPLIRWCVRPHPHRRNKSGAGLSRRERSGHTVISLPRQRRKSGLKRPRSQQAASAKRRASSSKIIRTEPNKVLAKGVEFHGFVYLQGVTAKDSSKDIEGQTAEVLDQIDSLLEIHGTDKTRLLQARSG